MKIFEELEQRGLIKIDPHFFKDEKRGKNRQTTNHYTVLCLTDDYYLDGDCKKHQIPNPPPSKSEGQTTILKTTTDDANCCVEYSSTNSNDIDFDKLRSKCINALIEDDQYDTTTISLLYKALNSIWRDETVLVNGTAYSKDQRQKLILDKLSVELLRIAVDSVSESAINVNEMESFLFRMLIDCEVSI